MKDALGHGSNAHNSGVEQVGKYTIGNDVYDAHSGEVYGSIYATHALTGKVVGAIDYGASNKIMGRGRDAAIGKEVNIKVADEHQHQGVASRMLDKLHEEFTREGRKPTLHWGGTTPEGTALRKAYYRSKAGK